MPIIKCGHIPYTPFIISVRGLIFAALFVGVFKAQNPSVFIFVLGEAHAHSVRKKNAKKIS